MTKKSSQRQLAAAREKYRGRFERVLTRLPLERGWKLNPQIAGMSALNNGIFYAALFGSIENVRPLFEAAIDWLTDALKTDSGAERDTVDSLYDRSQAHIGSWLATGALGKQDSDHLRASTLLICELFNRHAPSAEEAAASSGARLSDLSSMELSLLGQACLAKREGIEVPASCVRTALSLPISSAFRRVREALAKTLEGNAGTSLRGEYHKAFGIHRYETGLITGLIPLDVAVLSAAKENGNVPAAILSLLEARE